VASIYYGAFVCKHVLDRIGALIFIIEEAKIEKEEKVK
jgi:hypothetical protein